MKKTKFFDRFKDQLNKRQLKVAKKILDAEPQGFEGRMTAQKYMAITKASKATATKGLQDLTDFSVLIARGGGRSTHYTINILIIGDESCVMSLNKKRYN